LLDEIFRAEEALAPMTTELFTRSRTSVRRPVTIRAVQGALRSDEVLYEVALAEPASFGIIVTRSTARPVPSRRFQPAPLEPTWTTSLPILRSSATETT
jgi:hypothetical protein